MESSSIDMKRRKQVKISDLRPGQLYVLLPGSTRRKTNFVYFIVSVDDCGVSQFSNELKEHSFSYEFVGHLQYLKGIYFPEDWEIYVQDP